MELDFFHPRRDELRAAADAAYDTMNPDQGRIFDTILQRLADLDGTLFFVDGRAGRGKTWPSATASGPMEASSASSARPPSA
jgi:hypothetical protein